LSYIGAPRSTEGVLPEGTKSISEYSGSTGPLAAWLSCAFVSWAKNKDFFFYSIFCSGNYFLSYFD